MRNTKKDLLKNGMTAKIFNSILLRISLKTSEREDKIKIITSFKNIEPQLSGLSRRTITK